MSGLTYGILCAKNNMDVTICEQNARVGKKLSQTGNGKCNLGNVRIFPGCFNQSAVVDAVTNSVKVADYVDFLRSCGIFTRTDGEGRMYPLSDSASNVVDCLRHTYAHFGGKLQTETAITSVVRTESGTFSVTNSDGAQTTYDNVVLACGSGSSCSAPNLQSIVPQQYFTKLSPSLVPVKVANVDKSLDGIRVRANVTLYADGAPVSTESGEVQFKDYGLSGICIFNLSAVIARNTVLGKTHDYVFGVDVVPCLEENDLAGVLQHRLDAGVPHEQLFLGILHNKIAECVIRRAERISAQNLAHTAKNLHFNFAKLLDYSKSQVTAGGIDDKFVDVSTLTLNNGIVALGEVLNADGICGGYNLYFAAASAIYAFQNRPNK